MNSWGTQGQEALSFPGWSLTGNNSARPTASDTLEV